MPELGRRSVLRDPPRPKRRPGRQQVRFAPAEGAVKAALGKFPRIGDFDFIVQGRERRGGEPRIESFPASESRNPNPGTRTLEVRGDSLVGKQLENAIIGDMLHELGSGGPDSIGGGRRPVSDPEFRALKDRFIGGFKPEEVAFARQRFTQHKSRFPDDRRSFEDWFDTVWVDMWIGGLVAPINNEFIENAPKVLTRPQVEAARDMVRLLKKRR